MRVVALRSLREFWSRHADAERPLRAWYHDARKAAWWSPGDIRNAYRNASILANNRVVFRIKGNQYRLVVAVRYEKGVVYIRFIGTHHEYDQIDATTA
ncbi:MAG: addiction module toxin RelE [Armatimonadetes bacterium CG_4_10_14_3_um_filter_66_18]|nr:type II toxin-antitoxin system HigB family toxin [Armatimonadota bacterium]OIP06361.1 MAG: addiction module toxin RelE [Armatimonadetes bacterium CG2_30_66_41]PIX37828.1 MAG: addiction module toxin RelE [Armatimonadetes bacterium CG_4_8_14_3_um_filter_66_20]PIY43239.1 MAG: addiction module toxin RelE [Armatimonadetes bacterium CG_4_10_14_3_um_filter_66_18]PIZ34223.1 MAG: addiction module toxin RelE [Armatimonadetes bacterium CG_4_10_14_0_8_um_filter_66_14]PJB65255.1 MAG: addiction module to